MISARTTKHGDVVIAFTYAFLHTHFSINQSACTIEAARL